jgi:hypothetical protein
MELSMLRFSRSHFAVFGRCVLLVVLASPLAIIHEAHPGETRQIAVHADESAFLLENEAAMAKMMKEMAARPTGDIDHDFVAMMAPHHQGAIDMAVIELRYGKNEQLRRIAQEIVVGQMQEIGAMKLAIGEPAPASAPAPTQSNPAVVNRFGPIDFSSHIRHGEKE